MSSLPFLTEWLRLPDALLAQMPCHWQSDANLLWALAVIAALAWLALWITRNLVPVGPTRAIRQWRATAAVSCVALAVLGLCIGQLAQLPLNLPAPTLLAMQARWWAWVPLVLWLAGLLKPSWRHSLAWSRGWTWLATLGSVLLLFVMQLPFFVLGCRV